MSDSTSKPSAAKSSRPVLLALSALVLVVAATFWPGIGGGFTFDDFPNIVFNEALHVSSLHVRDWIAAALSSHAGELQRPLAMLTFALQLYFTGLDPLPLKIGNIAIHAFNVFLVFGLVRTLLGLLADRGLTSPGRQDWVALLAAALWALIPINAMPVLFIVQRMEILCHSFVFAGLWLYLDGRRRQLRGQPGQARVAVGLLVGTAVGALSKESAVLLPLYAFAAEWIATELRTADGRAPDRRLLLFYLFVLFLPAILAVSWLLPQAMAPGAYANRDFTMLERLMTEPRVLLDYLRWTLFPNVAELGLYHDDYLASRGLLEPPSTLAAMLALAALAALAWFLRRRRPLTALGIAWFLSAQALTGTFIALELVFEHRNYFASLGICLAIVDILVLAPGTVRWRRYGTLAACLLVVLYGALSNLRAREWSDPLRFAQSEVARHPDSPRATYQLGQLYVVLASRRPDLPVKALAYEALEHARRVQGSNILPAQGLLMLASRANEPMKEVWWLEIENKLRTRPIGAQEHGALAAMTACAVAERCHFPPDRMAAVFGAGLSQGRDPELLSIYGNYLLNVGHDAAGAEALWRESMQRAPGNAQYRINLTRLLIAQHRYAEARQSIAALRRMGRLDQYESEALDLEQRMPADQRAPRPTDGASSPETSR